MISSATQDFLSEVLGGERVPAGKLAYFQTRLAGNVHQAMLKVFGHVESQGEFTRRELAYRIGRKPEQITRWFSYPGNLTLSTVSDIFVGMGYELESITLMDLRNGDRVRCPNHQIDWLWLAGLHGEERQSETTPAPEQRSAESGQTNRHQSSARLLSFDSQELHTADREQLPQSLGLGRAAAAQLQVTGTRSSTQIGQAA